MKLSKKLLIISIIAIIGVVAFVMIVSLLTPFNLNDQFDATPKIYSIELWQPFGEQQIMRVSVGEEAENKALSLILQPTYHRVYQDGYTSDEESLALTIIKLYIKSNNVSDNFAYYVSNYGDLEIRDINRGKSAFYSLRGGRKQAKALYDELIELLGITL